MRGNQRRTFGIPSERRRVDPTSAYLRRAVARAKAADEMAVASAANNNQEKSRERVENCPSAAAVGPPTVTLQAPLKSGALAC